MQITITVSLEQRKVSIGKSTIKLSNPTIEHIKSLSEKPFTNTTATAAVENIIKTRIIPFIRSVNDNPTKQRIEKECNQAFRKHLFLAVHENKS